MAFAPLKFYTLVTEDDHFFTVLEQIVKQSSLLKRLIRYLARAGFNEFIPVVVPGVTADTLQLILEYLVHHYDDESSESQNNGSGELSQWEKNFFFNMNSATLFAVVKAASTLSIPKLKSSAKKAYKQMKSGNIPQFGTNPSIPGGYFVEACEQHNEI